MNLRMTVRMKYRTIFQRVWPTVHSSDDVVVVPAGFLADFMAAQCTFPFLPDEKLQNFLAVAQFVPHSLGSEFFPFQLVLRVKGTVSSW